MAAAKAVQFDLQQLRSRQMELAALDRAALTLYSYRLDWQKFQEWCASRGLISLPASDDTLSLWLIDRMEIQGQKVSTAQRLSQAVVYFHRANGHPSPYGPLCKGVLSASRRLRKEKPHQRAPLTIQQLAEISRAYAKDGRVRAIRNRALIVFGFASGMRRSNLAALQLSDLTFTAEGVIVRERSSKTDQFGAGREFGVYNGTNADTCPVRCVKAWIEQRGEWEGPLFTPVTSDFQGTQDRASIVKRRGFHPSGDAIYTVVKEALSLIGLDPSEYGAHSLRAGCVTAAVEAGASDFAIMRITGHKRVTTLQRYFRPVTVFPQRNIFAGKL